MCRWSKAGANGRRVCFSGISSANANRLGGNESTAVWLRWIDALLDGTILAIRETWMTGKIYNYGYRTPRFRADFRFLLQTGGRSPVLLNGRCTDLSEDGLAAEINASLEVGEQVLLIVTLPGTSTSMRISARVTNRRMNSYGFAFIFASQNQRSFMHEYIESRPSRALNSSGFSE